MAPDVRRAPTLVPFFTTNHALASGVVEASPGRPRGLRVRTTCATEAEFIALFHRSCDDGSVFAPTQKMLPEGADCAFSLELADGQPMLRGLGVVLGSWATADNRFAAAGVHIEIGQLTTGSQPIYERLLEARARAEGRPVARRRTITQCRLPVGPDEPERPDEPEDESVIRDLRRSITQEMQAAPVEPIDDRASHTIRYEGPLRAPAATPSRPGATRPPLMSARLPALPPPRRSAPVTARGAVPTPVPAPATAPMFGVAAVEPAALPDPPTYPGGPAFVDPPTTPEPPMLARGTPVPAEVATVVEHAAAQAGDSRAHALLVLWTAIAARWRTIAARLAPARTWLGARLASMWSRLAPARTRVAARLAPVTTRIAAWLRPASVRAAAWLRRVDARAGAWLRPAATRLGAWLRAAWSWLALRAKRLFGPTTPGVAPWWRNARVAAVFASGIAVGLLASRWVRPSSETRTAPIASMSAAQCTPASPAIAQPALGAPPPEATVAAVAPKHAPAPAPKHEPAAAPKHAPAAAPKIEHVAAVAPKHEHVAAVAPKHEPPAAPKLAVTTPAKPAAAKKQSPAARPASTPPAATVAAGRPPAAPAPAKVAVTAKASTTPSTPTASAKTAPIAGKPAAAPARAAAPATKTAGPAVASHTKKASCHSLDCI